MKQASLLLILVLLLPPSSYADDDLRDDDTRGPNAISSPKTYAGFLTFTFVGFALMGTGVAATGVGAGAAAYGIAISVGASEGVATGTGVGVGAAVAGGMATFVFGVKGKTRHVVLAALKEDAAAYLASEDQSATLLLKSAFAAFRSEVDSREELKAFGAGVLDRDIAIGLLDAT